MFVSERLRYVTVPTNRQVRFQHRREVLDSHSTPSHQRALRAHEELVYGLSSEVPQTVCHSRRNVFPRYHRISTPLTRHWPGATSRSVRHSCPHCSFSGQREQFSSRMSGRPTVEVIDACSASTSTIAGLPVSGQVTILVPRYREYARTSHTDAEAGGRSY